MTLCGTERIFVLRRANTFDEATGKPLAELIGVAELPMAARNWQATLFEFVVEGIQGRLLVPGRLPLRLAAKQVVTRLALTRAEHFPVHLAVWGRVLRRTL